MPVDLGDTAKDVSSGILKGLKTSGDFLSGPFQTDALLARLEEARIELAQATETLRIEEDLRDAVLLDLRAMGAKTIVLTALMTQIALTAPPRPGPEELDHLKREDALYDPLNTAMMSAGGLMLAAMLPGVAASTIKMISMGKFLGNASKGKTLLRFGKPAKGTAVLAGAIFLVETIIKMIHAQKLNAEIEKSRRALKEKIGEANSAYGKVAFQRAEAEALRAEMLRDAGTATVQGFLVAMNQAIADVSAKAALIDVCRNLLHSGQDAQTVAMIVQFDIEVVERIQRRLLIEASVISGQDLAGALDITLVERRATERVLAVRGDAARGFDDAELVAVHGVTDAVADVQIEIAENALKRYWDQLPEIEDFDTLAAKTLIPAAALRLLCQEMPVRAALWSGQSLEEVARANTQAPPKRVEALALALAAGRDRLDRGGLPQDEAALHLRLPQTALT